MDFTVKRRILNTIAVVFVLALFVFFKFFTQTEIGVALLMLFLLAYIILCFIWWRCPHCNSYLWRLTPFAIHCPYCGGEFE